MFGDVRRCAPRVVLACKPGVQHPLQVAEYRSLTLQLGSVLGSNQGHRQRDSTSANGMVAHAPDTTQERSQQPPHGPEAVLFPDGGGLESLRWQSIRATPARQGSPLRFDPLDSLPQHASLAWP